MGLDLVEYVMALENTFGIDIPDRDAERLATPRLVIEYLVERLPLAEAPLAACITQRAFYRVRAAAARLGHRPRRAMRPDTRIRDSIGTGEAWPAIGRELGARRWPRLRGDHRWARHLGGVETLGEAARHVALHDLGMLRAPDEPWTRAEIERLVVDVLEYETGVDMRRHTLDSRFGEDMCID